MWVPTEDHGCLPNFSESHEHFFHQIMLDSFSDYFNYAYIYNKEFNNLIFKKMKKNFINYLMISIMKELNGDDFEMKSLGIIREENVWYEKLEIDEEVYWYKLLEIKEVDEIGLGKKKGSRKCKEFGRIYMDYCGEKNSLCFKYVIIDKVLYYCFVHVFKRLRNNKDVGWYFNMAESIKNNTCKEIMVFANSLVKANSLELHSYKWAA